MLNTLFSILFSPIKPMKSDNKVSAIKSASRPLAFETVYSSNPNLLTKANIEVSKSTPVTELQSQPEQLERQMKFLSAQGKFSSIETVTLNEDTCLIGLMKHNQTIQRGIFMYPDHVQDTNKWEEIKTKASGQQTGIARFRVNQAYACLRLQDSDDSDVPVYLIDHRAISRIDSLWHPDDLNPPTYESPGKTFTK